MDIVWAKKSIGNIFWPAKLVQAPGLDTRVYVLFFGLNTHEYIESKDVKSYQKFRADYIEQCNENDFHHAIQLCDKYFSDAMMTSTAKNKNNKICMEDQKNHIDPLKNECEILNSTVIKLKKKNNKPSMTNTPKKKENEVCMENQQNQIDPSRIKNERLSSVVIELKKKNNKPSMANTPKKKEKEVGIENQQDQIDHLRNENKRLNAALADLKEKYNELSSERNKLKRTLLDSERDKKSMRAKIDADFEVENLLDYRIEDGERKFLVKWKQFQNTWENESNLNCPEILTKYMSSKRRRR